MGRKETNDALLDLEDLVASICEFEEMVRPVLLRGRFDSGQRVHRKGEYGEMDGTPSTHYSDPTGEDAVFWHDWKVDATAKTVRAMCDALHKWRTMAKWLTDELRDVDVAKRAKRTIPDCMACGDPCFGGVRGGFDDKCRKRWEEIGRPDRLKFIAMVKKDREANNTSPGVETRENAGQG